MVKHRVAYHFILILFSFLFIPLSSADEIDLAKSAKLISCGYYIASQTPERITDGNVATYWSCGILHSHWGEHWLIFDFNGLVELTRYTIRHAAAANLSGMLNTQEFNIEIAQNLDGPWEIIHTVHNLSPENINECIFPLPVRTRFVRLHILKPNYFGREDNFTRIAEIEFWGKKLAGTNFNLISSVQAATPSSSNVSAAPAEIKPIVQQNKTSAKPYTQPKAQVASTARNPNISGTAGNNWIAYLTYGALGIAGLVGIIILSALFRWIMAKYTTKKQAQQKQAAEQARLLKKQEEERKKLEKQKAVEAEFQAYFNAGLKAMEEGRYEDAAQAFYQAQGLKPDSTEAKSKLVYCKNLAKMQSGKNEYAA
ncbi:MAG: discoidin domain-containing protein [bacterium]|nr:discoidin domain-containing protein [bacterium]